MSSELNIQLINAPATITQLQYVVCVKPLTIESELEPIFDGVLSNVVNGVITIAYPTATVGEEFAVFFRNIAGNHSYGIVAVTDNDPDVTPVDPTPIEYTNAYLFSSSDEDSFILSENFTGELKVAWASNATTGVNANLLSGLQSAFVATTDYQNPKWNYSIFNGSNKWTLNGRSFAQFPTVILNKSWEIGITCAGLKDNDEIISGGTGEVNSINIDVTSGTIRAFAKVASATVGLISLPFGGTKDVIKLSANATGTVTLTVNGATATADWSSLNGSQIIEYIAKRGDSVSVGGTYTDFYYTVGGVTRTFPLTEGYRDDRAFFDTTGEVQGTKVKDALVDYTVLLGVQTVVDSTFNGIIGKYAKDGVWLEVNAGSSVDVYTPQPQITTVAMLGASIEDAVIAGNEGLMEKMLYDHGLTDIDFNDESTGGRHIDEIQAHWDTSAEAKYTALGDKVLVFTHMFANDIIGNNPYSTTSTAIRDKLKGWSATLLASIKANGNVPLNVEATFQSFSSPKMSLISWTDESLGAKPFNDNMVYPDTQGLTPPQWINSTGKPYATSYNWSYNFMKLLSTDGTHWGQVGSGLLRRLWADQIAHYIKGLAPVVVEKMSAEEAFNYVAQPLPVMLSPSPTIEVSPHKDVVGGNYWQFTANNTAKPLIPLIGYAPGSITVTSTADVMSHGSNTNGVFQFTGKYAATLEHHLLKLYYAATQSTTYINVMVLNGFNPNQSVKLGFASYYSAVDNRRIEFSVNGDEVNTVICNASYGHVDNVKYATFTADASGQIAIRCRKSSGYLAHFNGIHVIPQ